MFGEALPVKGTPLYTDVRLYCAQGIPAVIYGAGPRTVLESNAKRADEHLELDDLRKATKVVARTLLDLCKQPDAMTHPDGMQIKITRQEIGRIVGCSREMVGRVLKALEEQGLVHVKGKTMVVFGTR